MKFEYVLEGNNIKKKFRGFTLDVPQFHIPKGFATALIGENGAGKTTLMNILAGIRLDYKGELTYFGQYHDKDREENPIVKEQYAYTGPGTYYLPQWTVGQIRNLNQLLFENFHEDRFEKLCERLAVGGEGNVSGKKVRSLSDGNKMKLMIASALARDTKLLMMDEPASPLDPLMRDCLCSLIREHLAENEGENSVFFSTHNIADMENVTDYAIIMERGRIVEEGFVEDLKEKYVYVKGEPRDIETARNVMFSMRESQYGFEGVCLAEKLDPLAGCDVSVEQATLSQISVAVMKQYSMIRE